MRHQTNFITSPAMKKTPFLLIIALMLQFFFVNCSSDEPSINSIPNETESILSKSSRLRSIEEAAQIARDAIGMLDNGSSRSAVTRTFSPANVQTIESLNSRSGIDTLMYVFNFDDNMGYAVVAANKSFNPGLIAITENGNYQVGQKSNNPGINMFMENAEILVKDSLKPFDSIPTIPEEPNPELINYIIKTDTTTLADITPKYYLYWGQHYPEGLLCPNNVCGCAVTASLIAMATLEKPTQYTFNFSDGSQITEQINWKYVRRHKKSFLYETPYNNHSCVLLYDVHGIMSRVADDIYRKTNTHPIVTTYQTGLTLYEASTPVPDFENFFISLNMTENGFEFFTDEKIISWLNQGYAIIGKLNCESDSTTHALIVDGIKKYLMINAEWIKEYGKPWECTFEFWRKTETYYHLNWGWNGNDNGYFYNAIFKPDQIFERDPDTGSSYMGGNYYNLKLMKIK